MSFPHASCMLFRANYHAMPCLPILVAELLVTHAPWGCLLRGWGLLLLLQALPPPPQPPSCELWASCGSLSLPGPVPPSEKLGKSPLIPLLIYDARSWEGFTEVLEGLVLLWLALRLLLEPLGSLRVIRVIKVIIFRVGAVLLIAMSWGPLGIFTCLCLCSIQCKLYIS